MQDERDNREYDPAIGVRDIVMDVVTSRIGRAAAPYMGAIDVVIARLEERERNIFTFLMEEADDMDLDPRKVRSALEDSGLLAPTPEPTPAEGNGEGDMPAWARTLMNRIDALERRG